ncbi:vitamin K epoxide reductase family protein [Candidatus Gottesmanbacteria bacterium]|nr:vitamin K epoxide reductase family protein [Candidatus Gottesmanbacteria bacterium]
MKNRLIFILSIAGVAIAVYVLQSFLRDAPIVCINSGCEIVRKSPASRLFGIPVPGYGLVGYTMLATLAFLRTTSTKLERQLLPWIVGIATGGVAFVVWFTYTELFVIRGVCTWCAVSAVNMVGIATLAWVEYRNK